MKQRALCPHLWDSRTISLCQSHPLPGPQRQSRGRSCSHHSTVSKPGDVTCTPLPPPRSNWRMFSGCLNKKHPCSIAACLETPPKTLFPCSMKTDSQRCSSYSVLHDYLTMVISKQLLNAYGESLLSAVLHKENKLFPLCNLSTCLWGYGLSGEPTVLRPTPLLFPVMFT